MKVKVKVKIKIKIKKGTQRARRRRKERKGRNKNLQKKHPSLRGGTTRQPPEYAEIPKENKSKSLFLAELAKTAEVKIKSYLP